MIRSDAEYRATLKNIEANGEIVRKQRDALAENGLTEDQIERALQPVLSFYAQLAEEATWYEQVRRREIRPIHNLAHMGRMLIALRIANGMTQKELADRLGTSEAQVSRDERNEYHNITVERSQKILDALNEVVTLAVTDAPYEPKSPLSRQPEPIAV
ncbi:MAG: helix-turn-helix transcriptional regulator [Capsulimonadaceae bacterium]